MAGPALTESYSIDKCNSLACSGGGPLPTSSSSKTGPRRRNTKAGCLCLFSHRLVINTPSSPSSCTVLDRTRFCRFCWTPTKSPSTKRTSLPQTNCLLPRLVASSIRTRDRGKSKATQLCHPVCNKCSEDTWTAFSDESLFPLEPVIREIRQLFLLIQ